MPVARHGTETATVWSGATRAKETAVATKTQTEAHLREVKMPGEQDSRYCQITPYP